MKFQLAITTLLGALPLLTQALAHAEVAKTFAIERADFAPDRTITFDLSERGEDDLLNKRQPDDEWLLVMYSNGKDNQCGGTRSESTGKKFGSCLGLSKLSGKLCADIKVGANIGVAKCDFSFRYDGTTCGGGENDHETVYAGKDSNGVKLSDSVKFVSVTCSN
ncbi:hypothetical protein J3F84DRAFT_380967 [Trichoderma pleuroticola]